jgi:hypothetical protein
MRLISAIACLAIISVAASWADGQAPAAKPGGAQKSAVAKAPSDKQAGMQVDKSAAKAPAPKALLPDAFAGWVVTGPPKKLSDPAEADSANAAALKEYDFDEGATADYKRSGETLTLRLLRFHDASGAYGAYSFYRHNGWPKEDIGTGATSDHNRVIFWVGDTLVDANFSRIGPMSGSELRELASQIPTPDGPRALAPPVLASLPKNQLDGQTTHYALGPAGYVGAGGVFPPELVGFDRGAEAVTANYTLRSGPATLTIIDYPTPQMAMAQEPKFRAYLKEGSQAQTSWPKPLQDSNTASLEVKRSGPLVAIVSGDAVPDESHKLLATVHFESDLTSIPQPTESDVAKTSKLLLGIVTMVMIGGSAALLLGFFLGGGRALYRIARGKPASTVFDEEFIRIDLRDNASQAPTVVGGAHLKG